MTDHLRFGGRLARRVLGYFLLAALPAILLVSAAVWLIDGRIAAAVRARQARSRVDLERLLEDEKKRLGQAVHALSENREILELSEALVGGSLAPYEDLAPRLAPALGLELLSFVAAAGPEAGRIVSSAHLVDAAGVDAPPFARAADPTTVRVGLAHDFIQGDPPPVVPALFAVRAIPAAGERGLVILAGSSLAGRLRTVARAGEVSLTLVSPGVKPLAFPGGEGEPDGAEERLVLEALEGGHGIREPGSTRKAGDESYIALAAHAPELVTARRIFQNTAVALGLASALAAFLAAWVLTHRLSRPVLELSEAARRAGEGDLSVQVQPRSRDEMGALAHAFNRMVCELRTSREELARAERLAAWRQIARRVAHEIKNPLSPIRMSMETLQKSFARKHPDLEEIVAESTRTVLEEVRTLNRIVTEFSDFARMPPPEREPTPPADVLAHVASLYRVDPRAALHLDPGHASTLEPIHVDRGQVQRALINLVKNAMEAVAPHGRNVWIAAREESRLGEAGVAFEVADDGPGLPGAVRDDLFTPYVTTKTNGTGLGLAIVHRIASEHGGHVHACETPEGGARFVLWFPRGAPPARPPVRA